MSAAVKIPMESTSGIGMRIIAQKILNYLYKIYVIKLSFVYYSVHKCTLLELSAVSTTEKRGKEKRKVFFIPSAFSMMELKKRGSSASQN